MLVADPVYSPTRILTENYLKEFNIKTVFYNPHNLKTLESNITKKTKLIFVENPGSNTFDFKDLGKILSIAKKKKIFTALDNTWGTPYYLKPIKLGFDMAIVSATKYYSGHSDVMGGSLAVNKKVFSKVKAAEKITGLLLSLTSESSSTNIAPFSLNSSTTCLLCTISCLTYTGAPYLFIAFSTISIALLTPAQNPLGEAK